MRAMIPIPLPVLESMANSFATRAENLRQFGGGREENDGTVFAYPDRDGRKILKIQAFPLEDEAKKLFCLNERLRFAYYLGQNGARVAFPQLSPQNNLYETLQFGQHSWVGYTMEIAPGKTPRADAWDSAFFRNWGQMIGLNHRLAEKYPSWLSSVDPLSGNASLTWEEEWQGFSDWCQDADVKQQWAVVKQSLDALPKTRQDFGFIHNDPHLFNLVVDGDRITLLDFDVANHHWFLTDIAIASQTVLFAITGGMNRPVDTPDKLRKFLEYFLEGYEREHHLPQEWLDRLDLFIAYRRILLYIVMYEGIRSKPEEQRAWKHMILTQPEITASFHSVRK
jgi:amicoumacin kinase